MLTWFPMVPLCSDRRLWSTCAGILAGFLGLLSLKAGSWTSVGPHRLQQLTVPKGGRSGFHLLPPATTGLDFTNFVPESRYWTNQLLLDGGGVTAADVDGDGRIDLFFTGQTGLSSLWRNLGDWRFTNVTAEAFGPDSGLATLDGLGCAFADLNGDGAPDLVVNSHGQGTLVYFNDGKGHFKSYPTRLNPGHGGYSVAIADVDGDGWLDVYICNYRVRALMDMPNARANLKTVNGRKEVASVDGRPTTEPDLTNRFVVNARGGVDEVGEPDVLYRNLGGTNFVEVPWTDGAFVDEDGHPLSRPPFDWGLSAMFRDLNGDGHPELYVCNDFQSPDRLWINECKPGRVQFRAAPQNALRHTSFFSMGVDFADVNRDGFDDFLVLDMMSRGHHQRMTQLSPPPPEGLDPTDPRTVGQYPVNSLQMGRGDGTFAEVAAYARLQATEWSWTPVFLDVDLDGWEDLLVSNGQWRASRDLDVIGDLQRLRRQRKLSDREIFEARKAFPRFETPKLAFRNDGRGRFEETGTAWGFDLASVAHGMCLADLDGDGDLDVIVNRLNGPALLYQNLTSAARIAVRLLASGPNRFGIGARIEVTPSPGSSLPIQTQEIIAGGRYLSGDAPERVFAMGTNAEATIAVHWPDGHHTRLDHALPNHRYEIGPDTELPHQPKVPAAQPLFQDISAMLSHTNVHEATDEFIRQPLLPRRLGTEGPGVAWARIGGEARESLVIGAGRHGALSVYHFDSTGKISAQTNLPASIAQTTVLPWDAGLLVGMSTYLEASASGSSLSFWPDGGPSLAEEETAIGALAAADVDDSGMVSVFVGGRVLPGHWPAPTTSRLVKVKEGQFKDIQVFKDIGLVQAAVFSDLDQDGHPDLAVAGEWGPLQLFHNTDHHLVPWDAPVEIDGRRHPLSSLNGWWTSVQAGDFDGDGRPDLVAGNWGENDYHALYGDRRAVFYGNLFGSGAEDILEAYAPRHPDAASSGALAPSDYLPVHGFFILGQYLIPLRDRFPTHRAYASATLADLLGTNRLTAARVEANWFSSVVLLNRGDHFVLRRLPEMAQWSPIWGIVVADWDGDGHEDLFISQNYFGQNLGMTRNDAGRGLLLRGDGTGGFSALAAAISGIQMDGEGRGAATADFDGDGRPDLAIAQFRGATRLFHNVAGKPGLRVRLEGTPGNPLAAGASIRLVQEGKAGPVREIRLGGGHWSCDASTMVLARVGDGPCEVQVLWPGGAKTTTRVESTVSGLIIGEDGKASNLP